MPVPADWTPGFPDKASCDASNRKKTAGQVFKVPARRCRIRLLPMELWRFRGFQLTRKLKNLTQDTTVKSCCVFFSSFSFGYDSLSACKSSYIMQGLLNDELRLCCYETVFIYNFPYYSKPFFKFLNIFGGTGIKSDVTSHPAEPVSTECEEGSPTL